MTAVMTPELRDKISMLLQTAETSGLIQNVKKVFELLQGSGLMYSMTPQNKSGYIPATGMDMA